MLLSVLEEREIKKYVSLYDFSAYLRNKTILVTGSKGILGSGIIRWILYANAIEKLNCRIIASSRTDDRPKYIEESDPVVYCPIGSEREFIKGKLDYIIHTAAPTSNKIFMSQPVESLEVMVSGTKSMLELAKDTDAKMIYISSEEAYGTPNLETAIDEAFVGGVDSLNIRSCYPLGKKVAELMCVSYWAEFQTKVNIIRPTVILGLWQAYDSTKVEAEILRCVLENKHLVMKSDGSTKKCAIYSLDCISAIMTVLFKGKPGEAYNATNPKTYCSVKDRAYKAFATFNPSLSIDFVKSNAESSGYLPKRKLLEDISKIEQLGWSPMADMEYIYRIDIERFKNHAFGS